MNHDTDYVIETRALSKRYGRKLALDNLDLRIPRGRIHAIVGANGAGKSTLFRILMGFMPPSAGAARILGKDSQQLTPQDRARIGFVAPGGTPKPIIDRYHREITRILALPEVKRKLEEMEFDVVATTPDEFHAWIAAEIPRWGKVIRDTGTKAN